MIRNCLSMAVFSILVATGAVSAAAQQAQPVNGTITNVNETEQTVTVKTAGAGPEGVRQVTLRMGADANLVGVAALEDLKVGDEVRFEAVPAGSEAWQAQRLETRPERTGEGQFEVQSPVTDFFQNVKETIQHTWFSLRYHIEPDRSLYLSQGEQKVDYIESRINHLQEIMQRTGEEIPAAVSQEGEAPEARPVSILTEKVDGAGRNGEQLREAESRSKIELRPDQRQSVQNHLEQAAIQLTDARTDLEKLEDAAQTTARPQAESEVKGPREPGEADQEQPVASEPVDPWNEMQGEFDRSLEDARSHVDQAVDLIFDQRTAYEWNVAQTLHEMGFEAEQLQSAATTRIEAAEGEEVRSKQEEEIIQVVQNLQRRLSEARDQFARLESARGTDWADERNSMEEAVKQLRESYYEALTTLG